MVPWLTVVSAIFVAGLAFFIHRFADNIDQQLNACGTGIYVDGSCRCVHPYTGAHCEIIDCGYGKLVDSVWDVDSITTPLGDVSSGCQCENQFWGYNCANCTSMFEDGCTGECKRNYYGPRCEVLCKEGTEENAEGVLHAESGGTYNYFASGRGMCLRDGSVQCNKGTAGPDCSIDCKACKYGNCDAMTGECNCFAGYAGELCDKECPGRCSGNNGVCRWDGEFAYCECAIKHTGADCSLDCCARGNRTTLGVTNGECAVGVGGCICDVGWAGDECDCHPDKTCGSRGTCLASGACNCSRNFDGRNCEMCADDRIGPFCQYDKYSCPDNPGHGELVALNSHGDYGCKCDAGFTGDSCNECTESAYPKTGPQMCEFVVPDSMCHNGDVKDDYAGSGVMCECEGHFSAASDCAGCKQHYYGPACDVECTSTCAETGGKCVHTPTPGCLCPKGMREVNGRCQICGGDAGCLHGDCYGGRCECDAGWYGDNCDVSAPQYKGKTCNGDNGVPLVHKETASCTTTADCTDTSHPSMANAQVALRAQKYERTMFCYRSDVPAALRTASGCCVDSNADGKCDAEHLLKNEEDCANLEGEIAQDICDSRVLEGEVNVFEWCLSQQLGCTKNGVCADPDFCADRCDAGLTPEQWKSRWEMDHVEDMATLMSEPWRFPINSFDDPYVHRAKYSNASLTDVCPIGEKYDVCVDHLIPSDATVYNLAEKFVNGKWTQMPSYDRCKFTKYIKEVNVDGNKTVNFPKLFVHRMKMISDDEQTIAYGRLGDSDEAYYGEVNAEIDSVTLYGRGTVELVMYEFTDDACEEFLLRSAPDFTDCKALKIHELDYRWGKFCKWKSEMTGDGGFVEKCYDQSRVCVGCEEYQEGCEGLPLTNTPMPPPCASNWDGFCDVYMDTERNVQGTCAYADCECTGYGIGGEACGYNCPVPQYTGTDRPCGEGEDVPWGICVKGSGAVAFGYEQGTCECFNGGNPAEGCALMCTEEQSCSPDIDTPVTISALECDFANVESLSGSGWALSNASNVYYSDVVSYNKSLCGIEDEEAVGVCLKGPFCDAEISFEQTMEVCANDIMVHIYGDNANASTIVSPDEHCETGEVKAGVCSDACLGHEFYSIDVNESVPCICFNSTCDTVSGGTLYRYYNTPPNPGTTLTQRADACFHACRDKNDVGNPLTWSTITEPVIGFAVHADTGHCGCTIAHTECTGSGYFGYDMKGPKCMPRPPHLKITETDGNGVDRLFWGVPQDPITCNILLPDSMCNFWRGKCECAQPYTTFRKNNVPVYLNPDQSYRIALMQGYDIEEYVPFMKYQEPLPSIVTQISENRFCGSELDGLEIDEYTCTSCLGETMNKNTDLYVDMNGQRCHEYDASMCDTADVVQDYFKLNSGMCESSSIFEVQMQSIIGTWSAYDCETAGNDLGLSGTTDIVASTVYSGCLFNGVETKLYDFMPVEYSYAAGATCEYEADISEVSLTQVGSSTCMDNGHYKIDTLSECDSSLTSLGLPGLEQRCREFAGSIDFTFETGNWDDIASGCVYNEVHEKVYYNTYDSPTDHYEVITSGTCTSNNFLDITTLAECNSAGLGSFSGGQTFEDPMSTPNTVPTGCSVLLVDESSGLDPAIRYNPDPSDKSCGVSLFGTPIGCICKNKYPGNPCGTGEWKCADKEPLYMTFTSGTCESNGYMKVRNEDFGAVLDTLGIYINPCPATHSHLGGPFYNNEYWCYVSGPSNGPCRMSNSGIAPPPGAAWGSNQADCVLDDSPNMDCTESSPCVCKSRQQTLPSGCSVGGFMSLDSRVGCKDCVCMVSTRSYTMNADSCRELGENTGWTYSDQDTSNMASGCIYNSDQGEMHFNSYEGRPCGYGGWHCAMHKGIVPILSGTCSDAGLFPVFNFYDCVDAAQRSAAPNSRLPVVAGGFAGGRLETGSTGTIYLEKSITDIPCPSGSVCFCSIYDSSDSYAEITSGTCEDAGFYPIVDEDVCTDALRIRSDGYIVAGDTPLYASGCVVEPSGRMVFNHVYKPDDRTNCEGGYTCICQKTPPVKDYVKIKTDSCEAKGYTSITSINECKIALKQIDHEVPLYNDGGTVSGCTINVADFQTQSGFRFGSGTGDCSYDNTCICKRDRWSYIYREEDGPCTLGDQVTTKEELALAVEYMYGLTETFTGTGGGIRIAGSMTWQMSSETCSASHKCVCKIDKFVPRYELDKLGHYCGDGFKAPSNGPKWDSAYGTKITDTSDPFYDVDYRNECAQRCENDGSKKFFMAVHSDVTQCACATGECDTYNAWGSQTTEMAVGATTYAIKCPHGYSLSTVSSICELDPFEISLQTSRLEDSVITFNTYPPDCPEQTFTHSSENVWMGDHPNTNDRRKVIVDGETITCANL